MKTRPEVGQILSHRDGAGPETFWAVTAVHDWAFSVDVVQLDMDRQPIPDGRRKVVPFSRLRGRSWQAVEVP